MVSLVVLCSIFLPASTRLASNLLSSFLLSSFLLSPVLPLLLSTVLPTCHEVLWPVSPCLLLPAVPSPDNVHALLRKVLLKLAYEEQINTFEEQMTSMK